MALVKKLQPGGTIDQNALREEAGKYIEGLNLSNKEKRKVISAYDKLASHSDLFSVDPLSKTYTVTGPGAEEFQGSSKELHRGFLSGNIKINTEQDAMSAAAGALNQALTKMKGTTTVSTTLPTKSDINIGDLGDYVKNTIYGGSAAGAAYDIHKLTSDKERQAKTLEFANKYIADYLSRAETNKESFNATDIDKVKELQSSIKSGNWEDFRMKAYALKWNPEEFLLSDQEKQNIKEEDATKKLQDTTSAFTKAGINADVQEGLYKSGYTDLVNDWTPQGIDSNWFKNLLTKNNVATVYNPTTKKHQLVSGSKYFDYAENDRFSPYYGYSLKNDENGGVHAYNPAQSLKENVAAFGEPDEWETKNVGRQILTNLPGVTYGYSDERDGQYAKDILGRRDFTKVLMYETNGQRVKLTKGSDGKYRDEQGVEVPVQMRNYGPGSVSISTTDTLNRIYKDPNNPLSNIRPSIHYTDLDTLANQLTEEESLGKTTGVNEDKLTSMGAHLRWVLQNERNPSERAKALELYGKLSEIFKQNPDIQLSSKYSWKSGGKIIKGKKGMTAEEYIKKYSVAEKVPSTTSSTSQATKLISSRDRVGNIGAWDVASLAGTALSFIPGIGAIGGGVATIADIGKDISKDGFQASDIFNWNTAANLGFTALSLFGAGGVKALVIGAKAAKVGKAADLGFDIGRAAQKASALEAKALKLGLEVPETIKRAKNLATLDKMVSTETLKAVSKTDDIAKIVFKEGEKDALRSAGYIDESGKLIKSSTGENLLQTDLGSAFGISKASLTGVEGFSKQYLKEPIWGSAKFLGTQGSKLAKSKLVGKTATLGMISAGGLGAYNIGQEMLDAPEGTSIGDRVSRIKTSDLKNALIAGSLTKNWYSGAKNAKALLNQTEAKTLKDAERSITVGDKEFKVSDKVELPKVSKLSFKKDGVKQVQKLKSDLKAKLIGTDAEKEEAIKLIMKDDKLPTSITNNLVEGTSGERMLKSEINDRFSDSGRSIREYARAKKIIERQITSPGQLRARWKASKIAEAPVHPKAPKAPKAVVEEVVHVEPPKVTATPPSKSVKKKEVKPGEFYGSLFKSGGVLKLLKCGKGSRTAPIHQLPEVVKTAKKLPSPTGSNKINIAPELAKLKQQANSMPALKQPEIPKIASTGILPNDKKSGWLTDESGKLKLPKFDTTDVANALMYINTTQANKAIGRAQSNAAISGLYTLPYMSKQYQRISDPYSTLGTTEATKVQSKAGRLASTTSDIDKSVATNLEGTRQAADIRAKYNLAGVDRLDKLRQQQSTSDFRIDAANTETLAKNRAMFAGTVQKLGLIGANEINAQSAALNNLMTAWRRNQPIKEYKAGQQELLAAYKKPSLLAASEEYKKALSEETQQYYVDLYNKKVKNMPEYGSTPWESSAEAKQLQSIQKAAKEKLDLEYKPLIDLQVAQQYRSPYFKQGGSISLEDKVKLERYKEAVKRNNKEVELAYKTIKDNNEMLQKALIKVFK